MDSSKRNERANKLWSVGEVGDSGCETYNVIVGPLLDIIEELEARIEQLENRPRVPIAEAIEPVITEQTAKGLTPQEMVSLIDAIKR